MSRGTLCIILLSLCTLGIAGCGCNSDLKVTITTFPTTLAPGASSDVAATVTHDSKMGGVTWSCTPAGSCGSFNPTQTASGANSVYTAPTTAPGGGSVTIIATSVTKPSVSSSTNVTIAGLVGQNFTFYATGEENGTFGIYSIAGVVSIATDGSGTVVGGEQDYNDGNGKTITADAITGGTLTMAGDGSGNATLSITTASGSLGADGTEVFALAFANTSHAVIMQFDGTATSLGSLDLQSSTAQPTNTFSFVAAGDDPSGAPTADGGVFTVVSGALTGMYDVNDGGNVTLNTAIPAGATVSMPDSLGRGTVTGSGLSTSFVYYVVGPECLRLIDVDTTETAVGSAYGQGDFQGGFGNGSIGQSIFSMANSGLYAAAGQFTTDGNSFSGVGDLNESLSTTNAPLIDQTFDGSFTLATTGYGSMTFANGSFGDVVTFGLYAIDPTLNILDPNNKTSGGGSALLAEMDSNLVGIGAVLPQTDTAATSFSGAYAFGAQGDTSANDDEFDFVGEATVSGTTGAFAGTGALSDPFGALTGSTVTSNTATFNATAAPDVAHAGRYTLNPFTVGTTGTDFTAVNLDVVAYQANGGQLFWVEVDNGSEFAGSLEQVATQSSVLSRAKPKKNKP